jgi:type 1 glutamine amidotransferase
MRLDASKLDLNNPRVHRKDLDFAVTWAKMYGKGRVFYSTLGHVEQNWDDPRIQKMYVEAIKWAMGLVNADVTPRPAPAQSAALPADVASKSTLLGKCSIADVPLGASVRIRTACIAKTLF